MPSSKTEHSGPSQMHNVLCSEETQRTHERSYLKCQMQGRMCVLSLHVAKTNMTQHEISYCTDICHRTEEMTNTFHILLGGKHRFIRIHLDKYAPDHNTLVLGSRGQTSQHGLISSVRNGEYMRG